MVWRCACGLDIIVRSFLSLFPHCELSHFSPQYIDSDTSCECNSSYSFILILFWNFACVFFMVWGCACGLGIIVRTFCHCFYIVNLVIFHPKYIDNGYLWWAQLLLQFCADRFETLHMFFFMVWGCARGLDVIVITFCHFFHIVNLVIFHPLYINSWYLLWAQLLLQFCTIIMKLCMRFLHSMKICLRFGCNCKIIFFTIFHIVNFVIFHTQYIDSGYLVSTTPHTILY